MATVIFTYLKEVMKSRTSFLKNKIKNHKIDFLSI